MRTQRPLWLELLRGLGFWLLMIAGFVLTVAGFLLCAMSMGSIATLLFYGLVMQLAGIGILGGGLARAIFKWRRERSRAEKTTIILLAILFALLLSPFIFRKRTVPLQSNGRTVAIAKRPLSWGDTEFPVYRGSTLLFSLWGDAFDSPWFIYPFADGRRFLCIDDNDTSVLVFIVVRGNSTSNSTESAEWPTNEYTRTYLAETAPRVVTGSNISVRLPTFAEVREAADYVGSLSPAQFRKVSFPTGDLGLYRFYISRKVLLKELDANRSSVWP